MLLALSGATGFIGQHPLRELPKRGCRVRVLLRRPSSVPMPAASLGLGRRRRHVAGFEDFAHHLTDADQVALAPQLARSIGFALG
jgi:uncharacterized protein YbjT (DUF2867 family)